MTKNLRPYQQTALEAITTGLESGKEFVLASCPSSGKTFIALEYVRRNPEKNFLIIPHATTVLKNQWLEEASGIKNIKIELPHSLYKKDLKHYHTIIIDEAHEFSEASMVQEIIKKTKPKKILYLTGTPSKFILRKVPCHVLAAESLVPDYISDLYFGLFSTSADLKPKDFGQELDLLKEKGIKLVNSAEDDLNSLVKAMLSRLKSTNFFKSSPLTSKVSNFSLFSELGKTMIACHSQEQLKVIERILKKNNVKVTSSFAKDDDDSHNISNFEKDDNNVLLVLRRGILGYNMTSLVNVVDMTGTNNINRIYQLYARVMRKSSEHPLKYFFKLTTTADMQVTKFYMNAAIHLMRYDFISKYNGKNLDEMEVKVLRQRKKKPKKQKPPGPPEPPVDPTTVDVDPMFYSIVTANALLEDIWNKQSEIFNEYATMRIGKLKEVEFGIKKVKRIVKFTKENLLWMIKNGKVDERIYE